MGDEVALGSQISVVDGKLIARGETPAEIKLAIKELRLLKKEEQAKKREASARLKLVRAEWRERQAGRMTTVGLGRGTFSRALRVGIQANRRAERMENVDEVNVIEAEIARYDHNILNIDKVIAQCEGALLRAD